MEDIVVDTYKLKLYADRLANVNNRITRLDRRLDGLYFRVGLLGIFNLMQADALTCYSWRLNRCQDYLQQTATDFEKTEKDLLTQDAINFNKTHRNSMKEVIYNVGSAVKKKSSAVKSIIEKKLGEALYSYYSQGTVYKVIQYGNAVLKAAKGISKIAAGVASVIGTGGLSTPIAILSIISGANDFYNSIMDATYTYTGDYDNIGKDALKDKLVEGAGIIGEALGNKEVGETIGKTTYFGIDLVTSLAALGVTYDKVKQLKPSNISALGSELKQIGKIDVSGIFTTDMQMLKYQAKLASYTFSETTNFIKNAGVLYSVGKGAVKVGKGMNKILTANSENSNNVVIDFFDNVSKFKGYAKKTYKATSKITKFIFG